MGDSKDKGYIISEDGLSASFESAMPFLVNPSLYGKAEVFARQHYSADELETKIKEETHPNPLYKVALAELRAIESPKPGPG